MPAARRSGAWIPRALLGSLLVAIPLSALVPAAASYDPYAWIIWGREITEGSLTTAGGPSWKPLPVVFTTIFAVFGSAAPWLWLIVALAGTLAALVACWVLVLRLDGGPVGAAAAVGALAVTPWWLTNASRGHSEGLMVFCVFAALERMLAGKHRAAFALACGAALLRPECWPFLALYGLWLLWRQPLPRLWVIAAGAAVVACWFVPEWLSSGDPFRAGNRARTDIGPLAPTNADSPVLAILSDAWLMLVIPVIVGLAVAAVDIVRNRGGALAGIAALAGGWLAVVAVMTSNGFSGNQRYLIVPVALLIVVAGAAIGRLFTSIRSPHHHPLAVAAVGLAFAVGSLGSLQTTWDRAAYQEAMTEALPRLVDEIGGAASVRRCGAASTGRFLVPQVAWNLHLHQREVTELPRQPGTVFAVQTTATSNWGPPGGAITDQAIARHRSWRIYQRCAGT